MHLLVIILSFFTALFLFTSQISAAAPDGMGPWADNVVSSGQGLMKNGLAVPSARSDTGAALGEAEGDSTIDSHFFSLGFGGNIVLGFENGISSGILVVESTNPNYPLEKAKVEVSENGTTWTEAGTVVQDGTVSIPAGISCTKFVRITDISDPAIFPDDIADGYDVDGAKAVGDSCSVQPSPQPSASGAGTTPPPPPPPGPPGPPPPPSAAVPGFPNAGTCPSSNVTAVPGITEARRVSPSSIFISWGSGGGFNDFVVQYGYQDGNWQFGTKVSGTSTTIGELPAGQSVWFHVAATDNCAIGAFSGAVLVGGTPSTNVPGFPNTGNPSRVPRLPNTGIGPDDQSLWTGLYHILTNLLNALSGGKV